ncbi:DNA N-6-adenine-methyltransferase [Halorubrum ezzemoulense]|uniref:DNA N-6-adenine-methyltransferase n=1 Tax=Halorubrum ezzemoulense TaxID=337243 RepID=UPI00232BF072|nr:DNA N-6-adenine-methyltransferase [Halorubrum ezzemoulense]MDB9247412.1 DNA N-6-adenine-methyltransferase [Halorubrum ezzemoulense]MDB9258679.1 DNA N-6-adenine-methyltransferase [Halorubrum ezzemoulense]MDB9264463.1 DNA N-6-adenine-methyltransferase [Halorubrum ezzemoulense]MDB9269040.1 DNA N-6-adenine-methyltransferase [Halorubrum ezzemoulense]MDB9271431.1 DNA N-6-adenine-methyltransferase [Halorubrum ezzemoulense]
MPNDHRHYDETDAGPEWGTPKWVWQPLAETLGGFDLDPASGAEEEPIAYVRVQLPTDEHPYGTAVREEGVTTWYGDGLEEGWHGDVWLNPPYGRQHNPRWAQKVSEEVERGALDTLTALVPASTSTNWFQDHYANADLLTFIDQRISFDGSGSDSASFASVIATFGDVPTAYVDALGELGFVVSTDVSAVRATAPREPSTVTPEPNRGGVR